MKIKYRTYWIHTKMVVNMNKFEDYLHHVLDELPASVVLDAMNYSLLAGGKRIRPNLLFHALRAYGIEEEKGYAAAAAIEMIHTYSLIHDDLPAMDNDTLRRGKPTCHVKFGEGVAILAGDGLLTQAFCQLLKSDVDAQGLLCMSHLLADFSGANGMILGQIKDLEGEGNPQIDVEGLKDIHIYKTGKLITLPLLFASIIAHHQEDCPVWEEVGRYIGLSFQIQDDVLDVTSTNEVLGKNVHSDAENDKRTYVSLMGIEDAKQSATLYYEKAWSLVSTLSIDATCMKPVFDTLAQRKN